VRKPYTQYQHFTMTIPVPVEVSIDVCREDDEVMRLDVMYEGLDVFDELTQEVKDKVMQAIESDAQQRPDRDDR